MKDFDFKDQLDTKIKEELESYLKKLPVGGKETGWERIERELYSDRTIPLHSIKWCRWVAVAVIFMLLTVVFFQVSAEAWVYRVLKEFFLKLSGPTCDFVTVIAPEGRGGISESNLEKPTLKDLSELSSVVSFTPLIVSESSEIWTLTGISVRGTDNANACLVLQYKNATGSIITFTQEVINNSQSESFFYDEEDAQLKEYQVRGVSVKILTYKNGFTRAWWAERNLSLSLMGAVSSEEVIAFIKTIEPYNGEH